MQEEHGLSRWNNTTQEQRRVHREVLFFGLSGIGPMIEEHYPVFSR
jgi:hypothetical protein